MKVIYNNDAKFELAEIEDYISHNLSNPQAAERLVSKIDSEIQSLADFPYSGSAISDEPYFSFGYRRLLVKNFVVIYKVFDELQEVHVLHIYYAPSNYLSRL